MANTYKPVKAFLSHSSRDKNYADVVAGQFSSANMHYDAKTFEQGEQSSEEIFKALEKTDVFVLLLSRNSIESPWVQSEIAVSQHRVFSGSIKRVIVFVLDDLPSVRIPDWLRMYVHRRAKNAAVISNVIRSSLIEIESTRNPVVNLFIGRDTDLAKLKARLADVSGGSPKALFVSGWDGIGRRTLVRRVMGDVFSSLVGVPLEVTLRQDQGDIELYRDLVSRSGRLSFTDLVLESEAYANKSLEDRIPALAKEVDELAEQRQLLLVRGSDALISDDGELKGWVSELIKHVEFTTWPSMAFVSKRSLTPGRQPFYPDVSFHQVTSLSKPDTKTLLSLLLKHKKVVVKEDLLTGIVDAVDGHPKSAVVATAFVEQVGVARVHANPGELVKAVRGGTSQVLQTIRFESHHEQVLTVFREYEVLSAEDLLTLLEDQDAEKVGEAVAYLQDFGVLEAEADHLRLAPFLVDAVSRHKMSIDVAKLLTISRVRMIAKLSEFMDSDVIPIQTVDSVVLSALRSATTFENPLLGRALLPSHLLRVAREQYDQRRYARAAELAQRAYEGKSKLSAEAQVEALRLAALSWVHHGNKDDEYRWAQRELASLNIRLATRVSHFVAGTKAKTEGDLTEAERHFLIAYNTGGERSFHILRQLASIFLVRENYPQAEKYARTAAEVAPESPYVLDVLVRVLIEAHWNDAAYLTGNVNFLNLMDRLEALSAREQKSFYEVRQGQLKSALGDRAGAIDWAMRAVQNSPNHPGVLLQLARIQLVQKQFPECKETLNQIDRLSKKAEGEDKRWRVERDKLLVQWAIDTEDFDGAIHALGRARSMPKQIQAELQRRIDAAKAYRQKR